MLIKCKKAHSVDSDDAGKERHAVLGAYGKATRQLADAAATDPNAYSVCWFTNELEADGTAAVLSGYYSDEELRAVAEIID